MSDSSTVPLYETLADARVLDGAWPNTVAL
jgi:hypothetical protein